MEDITFELKYCERCGALGLRRSQSSETYCEPCGQLLMSHAAPGEWARQLARRSLRSAGRRLLQGEYQPPLPLASEVLP